MKSTITSRPRPPFAGALILGVGSLICGKASTYALDGGAAFYAIFTLGAAVAVGGGVMIARNYMSAQIRARRSA